MEISQRRIQPSKRARTQCTCYASTESNAMLLGCQEYCFLLVFAVLLAFASWNFVTPADLSVLPCLRDQRHVCGSSGDRHTAD